MYWNGTAEFKLPANLFPALAPAAVAAKVSAIAKASTPAFIQGEPEPALSGHGIYGTLIAMRKGSLTLRTRNAEALKAHQSAILTVGDAVLARGEYDSSGVMHARSIQRAQPSKALWGSDY